MARHLVAAGQLIDSDPRTAYEHTLAARARASRLAVVREAVGEAAYAAGEYAEALAELKAAKRMNGAQDYVAIIADCERALKRPDRALAVVKNAPKDKLAPALLAELTIVEAGARRDRGELDAALRILETLAADGQGPRPLGGAAALRLRRRPRRGRASPGRPDLVPPRRRGRPGAGHRRGRTGHGAREVPGGVSLLGRSETPLREAYDVAVLDLDGVVYRGREAVPGAPEALNDAQSQGMHLAFVTNNASRPPATVGEHLRSLGVEARDEDVVNSAQAAARLLAARLEPGSKVFLIGGEGLELALRERDLVPVSSVGEHPSRWSRGTDPTCPGSRSWRGRRSCTTGCPGWPATPT